LTCATAHYCTWGHRVHLDEGSDDELSYNLDKNNDVEEMV